ncbi:MAG: winged helix-turn-helix domain-containing protein [Rhodospirillales bacterium]|nr:winged helix-turn-helix domain-containing protein [Rhodospirillales bacterium]
MIYLFNKFKIDDHKIELFRDGVIIQVEPQVFNLILFLIKNRESVKSKDEIIETVWGGKSISDASLNSRINLARRALSDDGKSQRIIKTFSRRGFRFVADVIEEHDGSLQAHDVLTFNKSILILPFNDLSADIRDHKISESITDELIINLTQFTHFSVLSRNISFQYKKIIPDILQISKEKNIDYILEGNICKDQYGYRSSIQIADPKTGKYVWAHRLSSGDLGVLQERDQLVDSVGKYISRKIGNGDALAKVVKPNVNNQVFDLCLRGRELITRFSYEDNLEAEQVLDTAIILDPNDSIAYSLLSECFLNRYIRHWDRDDDRMMNMAHKYAKKSYMINNHEPFSLWANANVLLWKREFNDALKFIDKALELEPRSPLFNSNKSMLLSFIGDTQLSKKYLDQAMIYKPIHEPHWFHTLANIYLVEAKYERAIEALSRRIRRNPKVAISWIYLSCIFGILGKVDQSKNAWDHALALYDKVDLRSLLIKLPFKDPRHFNDLVSGLSAANIVIE